MYQNQAVQSSTSSISTDSSVLDSSGFTWDGREGGMGEGIGKRKEGRRKRDGGRG